MLPKMKSEPLAENVDFEFDCDIPYFQKLKKKPFLMENLNVWTWAGYFRLPKLANCRCEDFGFELQQRLQQQWNCELLMEYSNSHLFNIVSQKLYKNKPTIFWLNWKTIYQLHNGLIFHWDFMDTRYSDNVSCFMNRKGIFNLCTREVYVIGEIIWKEPLASGNILSNHIHLEYPLTFE